MTDPDALLF
ncbi:unnamed protein product, partial [Rotaria sp. Silwood1]